MSQACKQLELEQSSTFVVYAVATVTVLANLVFTLYVCTFASFFGGSVHTFFATQVMAGFWPVIFGYLCLRIHLRKNSSSQSSAGH